MSMKKKVLLMGRSGSGKTSMRSIIFSNQVASDTRRFGATIDIEMSNIKFLGELRLDLWDCGGQESFMDDFLNNRQDSIFRQVHSLIYIFDVESPAFSTSDLDYFVECLSALRAFSGSAGGSSNGTNGEAVQTSGPFVHVLIHKMDLVQQNMKEQIFAKKSEEIRARCKAVGFAGVRIFGTSIWNETLYKAWSQIVSTLIPNVSTLRTHLDAFAGICNASEVVLFERTTFLVISRSTDEQIEKDLAWEAERFEKISQCIKMFRLSCQRMLRIQFQSMEIKHRSYTAVLAVLTPNTYIMVVSVDSGVQPSGILLNIRLHQSQFAQLQAKTWGQGF